MISFLTDLALTALIVPTLIIALALCICATRAPYDTDLWPEEDTTTCP